MGGAWIMSYLIPDDNRGQISETFTNYETKDLLHKNLHELRGKGLVAQVSETRRLALYLRTRVDLMFQLESSWHGRSVHHVLPYSGQEIAVRSKIRSRITRQKTCCARALIMSYHIPDDKSGSDLRNLHELRGKRLVAQVSETRRFALYLRTGVDLKFQLEPPWHGRSVDHVLPYSRRQIAVGSQKPSLITRQRLVAQHGRSVDHVLTYSGRQIAVGSQKPTQITRQMTCCASELNKSVRVVFANRSGFDAPIGVVLAWEERGSCLNIFWTKNHGRISEIFTNNEVKDLLRNRLGMGGAWIMPYHISDNKSQSDLRNLNKLRGKRLVAQVSEIRQFALYLLTGVDLILELESSWHWRSLDHVLTYSGLEIAVGSQKPSRIMRQKTCCARSLIMSYHIPDDKSRSDIRETLMNYEAKDMLRKVVMAWEERGSYVTIFWTTIRGRISETFTNYEAKDLLRKNIHELRGKGPFAQVSETRRFALYLRTRVDLVIQLESSRHGRSVDHVSKYTGREIVVGSQKPSRITRQKPCCVSELNTSVWVVFANRSRFDAPIGVFLAWEER
ncbi:uncharacterized protein G2W53_009766 [Senna tora]|uniref:Uncharacterized protein n=1 Tax=Senna tora TaxID=362788 RepID=A0A834WYK4_9FABA|nr:uncharacterized protein G2W53_009766 [Senna tora]